MVAQVHPHTPLLVRPPGHTPAHPATFLEQFTPRLRVLSHRRYDNDLSLTENY